MNGLVSLAPLWAFSWVAMLLMGNALIRWLKNLKGMKWSPREDTPDSHLAKAGTPSMGGLGIIASATLAWLAIRSLIAAFVLFSPPPPGVGMRFANTWQYLGLVLFPLCVLSHCALGFADDWSKATRRGGLSSKAKLLGQVVLAMLFLLAVRFTLPNLPPGMLLAEHYLIFGALTFTVALVLIIGTSNAVNLTDGIDGLAAGLCVQVALAMSVVPFDPTLRGVEFFASTSQIFWMALGGACLGFLAFNKNPAKVFMGDTGSLALGAALGAGAILTRSVFLLPFIGFIFYIEMFSVMAQVAYFKWTKKRFGEGKRIFRRAPLHHHFELGGWSEWRVVGTFWAINALATILGLALWKMGVLPRFP